MSYIGDWTPYAAPGDEFIISASISLRLGTDTISAVTGTIAIYQGVDPAASTLALAPAAFSGATVSQLVGGAWIAGKRLQLAIYSHDDRRPDARILGARPIHSHFVRVFK